MSTPSFDLEKSQTTPSYTESLYFKAIQSPSNHQSELIYRLVLTLFAKNNPLVLENKYQHLQKLLESANDLHNLNTSSYIIRALIKHFEKDPRILKHHVLNLYKVGADVRGDSMLKTLLGADQQNRDLQHVGLAYFKKNMLQHEYAKKLADYLEKNFTDVDAWVELGNIYEENLDFDKATHCYEEVLLLKPNDMRVFMKLGQLYFTQGTQSKMEIAKKYFCYVLTIQGDNLRALYGLKNVLEFTVEGANQKRNVQNRKLKKLVEMKIKEFDGF